MYAPTGGFPQILALHPKSLRQIGELGFFGMNSGSADEPLMGGLFFFEGNGEGIEALAKPIFVRAHPFNGWRPVPPSPRIQNGFARLVALRAIRAVLTPAG
ncbi:MAG: hypothetical protein BHW65_08415 [Verrucomicrobia bacterium CAG:312_58_20]|nr:MAG: hypothetical protein BHW65_08415 [Verrucomicrobia bacterium CAG:312_58_20]